MIPVLRRTLAPTACVMAATLLGSGLQSAKASSLTSPASWPVPGSILLAAEGLIVDRVGRQFFEQYIHLDSTRCRFYGGEAQPGDPATRPFWQLIYLFRIPPKPWAHGDGYLFVDSTGALVQHDLNFYGLCNCQENLGTDGFAVDESTAIAEAKLAGFEQGLEPWEVRFGWAAGPTPCYAWSITNTLKGSRHKCYGEGKVLVVDACTAGTRPAGMWVQACESAPKGRDPGSRERIPGLEQRRFAAASDSPGPDHPPVVLKRVRPVYPDSARAAQSRGKVILHVLVGTDGRAEDIKVMRGISWLNAAAIDCVRQWEFRPALSGGNPVRAWLGVSVSLPVDACPQGVLEGGTAAVTARVGEKFFSDCFTLDSSGCAVVPGWLGASKAYYWALAYSLKVPKKPWVRGTVRVEVDSAGTPLPWQRIEGIGDCVHHPEECDFSIDERAARGIAKRAGLKAGLKPWRTEFRWENSPRARYVWLVANTLSSDGSSGDNAKIDANSGEVLGLGPWFIETKYEPGPARRDTTRHGD